MPLLQALNRNKTLLHELVLGLKPGEQLFVRNGTVYHQGSRGMRKIDVPKVQKSTKRRRRKRK